MEPVVVVGELVLCRAMENRCDDDISPSKRTRPSRLFAAEVVLHCGRDGRSSVQKGYCDATECINAFIRNF